MQVRASDLSYNDTCCQPIMRIIALHIILDIQQCIHIETGKMDIEFLKILVFFESCFHLTPNSKHVLIFMMHKFNIKFINVKHEL